MNDLFKPATKKPVTVKAVQFTKENRNELGDFLFKQDALVGWTIDGRLKIITLEGVMIVEFGDYVIEGVQGEFYPCKPSIFEETYDY